MNEPSAEYHYVNHMDIKFGVGGTLSIGKPDRRFGEPEIAPRCNAMTLRIPMCQSK